jgi:hypothetical protein
MEIRNGRKGIIFYLSFSAGCYRIKWKFIREGAPTMEIKEQIEKMAKKVLNDKDLMDLFKKDPIKAVEKILGVDLPDDIIEKIIAGVKAQITVDNAKDVMGVLKKLF